MKEIAVTGGLIALVDDEDAELVGSHSWCIQGGRGGRQALYAQTRFHRKTVAMHRMILDAPRGVQVDHINGNGLDNRRENLRLCTNAENHGNMPKPRTAKGKPATSLFKGVSWCAQTKRWSALIHAGKQRRIGRFATEVDAARAYNAAALKAWGEFARLNVVTGVS